MIKKRDRAKINMETLMTFKKIKDGEENFLVYDEIEILQFNYNGTGGALVYCDGYINTLDNDSIDFLFNGDYTDLYYDLV